MKLFVGTNEHRTEVLPMFNGTAPQHYAACIQIANDCLNNSLPGLQKATDLFIENMKKHPGTAEIVKYTYALAPVLSAGSDKELRESMANFLVQTEEHNEASVELPLPAPHAHVSVATPVEIGTVTPQQAPGVEVNKDKGLPARRGNGSLQFDTELNYAASVAALLKSLAKGDGLFATDIDSVPSETPGLTVSVLLG